MQAPVLSLYRVGSEQGAPALTPLAAAPLKAPVTMLPLLAAATTPELPIPLTTTELPLAAPELGNPSIPELPLATGDVDPLPASKPWYAPPAHPEVTIAARSVDATRAMKSADLMTRASTLRPSGAAAMVNASVWRPVCAERRAELSYSSPWHEHACDDASSTDLHFSRRERDQCDGRRRDVHHISSADGDREADREGGEHHIDRGSLAGSRSLGRRGAQASAGSRSPHGAPLRR